MIRENATSGCARGRLYYYDFLEEETRRHIPQELLRHIATCGHCRAEVDRLRAMLVGSDVDEQSVLGDRKSVAVASVLKLHFAHAGRCLTCRDVKPLLPGLCDQALGIRVLTPVTAHVDNCPECSRDVSILKRLNLAHRQLCRLGQLFADKPERTSVGCGEALAAVDGVVAGDLSGIGHDALRHLCTCTHCRESLYRHREDLLDRLSADKADEEVACQGASPGDLFAYCLPYGVDQTNEGLGDWRPEEAAHILDCPTCLSQVQELHQTLCDIAERPNSAVVTRFTLSGPAGDREPTLAGEPRLDWAANVEVYNSRPEPEQEAEPVSVPEGTALRAKRLNIARFIKPVAVAAAAVLVVSFLLINTPAAKAVDLRQVYDAIARIKNVCISRFEAGETEPHQKEWVSQSMNIRLFATPEEVVLWDITNGVRKAKSLASGALDVTTPSEALLKEFGNAVANSFGLMPFSRLVDVPEGAEWTRVDDATASAAVPGTGVYELAWVEPTGQWAHKNRFWVDPKTELPTRVEFWRRDLISGANYVLNGTIEVEYPTDGDIQALIDSHFD